MPHSQIKCKIYSVTVESLTINLKIIKTFVVSYSVVSVMFLAYYIDVIGVTGKNLDTPSLQILITMLQRYSPSVDYKPEKYEENIFLFCCYCDVLCSLQ